ncbi:MAG: hypothetical protein COS89_05195 [Deltaproteobacteria bacterium CG07_land_8_20_14_0_80_38_7]|nr:MAG: hypothetical protein COS89_05195 [Deltaproteobacteria bacterium CG07_land_8_20_14_0_80_38_7]
MKKITYIFLFIVLFAIGFASAVAAPAVNQVYDTDGRLVPDSDYDFVADKYDNCPNVPNGDCNDPAHDNCPDTELGPVRGFQIDTDANGIGDDCDDSDRDEINYTWDNCPTIYNPDQEDLDANTIGDHCTDSDGDGYFDGGYECDDVNGDKKCDSVPGRVKDNCPNSYNTLQLDFDGDGVGDSCDNCRYDANKDQSDVDHNGKGDLCSNGDYDHDGVLDSLDNCPLIANQNQLDTDIDGIGDSCDNCPFVVNFEQIDSNGDGIGDDCSVTPGINPLTDMIFGADIKQGSGGCSMFFSNEDIGTGVAVGTILILMLGLIFSKRLLIKKGL